LEVASKNKQEHARHLRELFLRLREHGLVINLEKCVFGVESIDFLGQRVSAAGVAPLPDHVEAVTKFPRPSTVKELQGFLGLVNFYRRFIPAAASILKPLTDSLKGGPKGAERIVWRPPMEKSFHDIKAALAEVTMLAHPLPHAHLSITVDASASHVGACLQQRRPGGAAWEPLGFFSRKLEPAQVKYPAFDRELLACYLGIRHFRYMLEGRHFTISRIISRLRLHSSAAQTRGRPASADSSHLLLNVHQISGTWRAKTTWLRMRCLARSRRPSRLPRRKLA
jgi:hypothetical protein